MDVEEFDLEDLADEDLLVLIARCANELGWGVALPSGEEEIDGSTQIEGIVIGTRNFIQELIGDNFETSSNGQSTKH